MTRKAKKETTEEPEPLTPHDHCWHDQSQEPAITKSTKGKKSKQDKGETSEMCCHCGELRTRKTRLVTPPGHGEYAPKTTEYEPEPAEERPYEPEQPAAEPAPAV